MSKKAVALCPTFARPEYLAHSIKCFLDQDYENKELIICNDYKPLSLFDDYPNVKLINIEKRFNSIGEKRNYLKSICQGDYMFLWEDDDLYFPWRMSESIKYMEEHPNIDIVNPYYCLMSTNNSFYRIVHNNLEGQACIRREYYENNDFLEGPTVEDILHFFSKAKIERPKEYLWQVYRWGLNVAHISGYDPAIGWQRTLKDADLRELSDIIKVEREYEWQNLFLRH